MKKQSTSSVLVFSALVLSLTGAAEAAAVVDSVLDDGAGAPPKVVILGSDLAGAVFRLAGTDIPASCVNDVSDAEQHIGYCAESALAVPGPGSYNLVINGSTEFSVYFEQAIVVPAPPPPPGDPCPCESEWNYYGGLLSPNGFAGLDPYCVQESGSGDFVTVHFYDEISPIETNYWVLWTEWLPSSSSGYCELWLDGPTRILDSEDQFSACASYLKESFDWAGVSDQCLF